MPKSKNDHKRKTATLIYKNSRNTINTFSKTYSGASQMFTRSLILQLKQNLHNEEYYEENGTVKRDLSIETDICILRGYYKKKRNKLINHETVSTKSKYSVVHTEIDTIDKFKYDGSACGDSEGSFKLKDTHFNINLTSLVVQNLKKMLNDWITKYLLDNDKTKQKIESVLDSLLHKLDLQQKDTVSSCTYTVDIELYKKLEGKLISHSTNSHGLKQGSFSVPLDGKSYRVLSTLSVPKNFHRHKKCNRSWKKFNKIRHKKILLSTNGSSKYLFTSSSLNFLTLPTQFLTKCCATYQNDIFGKREVKQKTLFLQDELCGVEKLDSFTAVANNLKNINNATNAQNSALNTFPSMYNNIYEGPKHSEIHGSRNIHPGNIHEQDNCVPLVPIDKINQSFIIDDSNTQKYKDLKTSDLMKDSFSKKTKKVTKRNKKILSRLLKHKYIKSKLITSPKCGDYVKLDIHVNVFPSSSCKAEKNAVNKCEYSQPHLYAQTTPNNTEIINNNFVSRDHNIIPLLDGALSQVKYMVSGEISTNNSEKNNPVNNPSIDYINKESQIAQEIGELKLIIKALANTTEKLVNEHLNKISYSKDIAKPHSTNKRKQSHKDLKNVCKPSIGVQISSKCVKDSIIGSGIKLKKDPKKKRREYHPRLMKKSTSYNIIDSESILKVTDMTSAAQGEINVSCKVDRALTCSLLKTKLLYEVSVGTNDDMIVALPVPLDHRNEICDEVMKQGNFIYNVCELKPHTSNPDKPQQEEPAYNESKIRTERNIEDTEVLPLYNECDSIKSDSTVCIDIETKPLEKKMTIRHTGVTCCGGCLYCIFLWIPVILIVWFFYKYVLKDYLPENFSLPPLWTEENVINEPYFRRTLADLGF